MTNTNEKFRPNHIQKLVMETRTGLVDNHKRLSRCGKKGGEVAAANKLVYRFKKDSWLKQVMADAEAHAEANRAGWDDNYDPLD